MGEPTELPTGPEPQARNWSDEPPFSSDLQVPRDRLSVTEREAWRDAAWVGGPAQAMLLVRAPGKVRWLGAIVEAIAEVERVAGVRPSDSGVEPRQEIAPGRRRPRRRSGPRDLTGPWPLTAPGTLTAPRTLTAPGTPTAPGLLVEVLRMKGLRRIRGPQRRKGSHRGKGPRVLTGPRLLVGPPLPGLVPVAPATARAHLAAAGSRGLPAPLRRWRPAAGAINQVWRPGAGSVLTCDGPDGASSQAVVALYGLGDVAAIAPPPGGALVLRAWRARPGWGLACGLVLGAATALGLGRDAGRIAARARTGGWDALVLNGSTAVQLAGAGDPALPVPEAAARAATSVQVAALLEACLAAGGLGSQAVGSPWVLPVTP